VRSQRVLEREPTRKRRFGGPRKAIIQAGTPVDISRYASEYKTHKHEVLQAATQGLEYRERALLVRG
jgi:hypothetical protein